MCLIVEQVRIPTYDAGDDTIAAVVTGEIKRGFLYSV